MAELGLDADWAVSTPTLTPIAGELDILSRRTLIATSALYSHFKRDVTGGLTSFETRDSELCCRHEQQRRRQGVRPRLGGKGGWLLSVVRARSRVALGLFHAGNRWR